MPNCSATTSETWLGSITPPDPTWMLDVASARWPISTAGADTGDAGHVVVLGDPEAAVPEMLGPPGQLDGGAQGVARGPSLGDRRQVEHGQRHITQIAHDGRQHPGLAASSAPKRPVRAAQTPFNQVTGSSCRP